MNLIIDAFEEFAKKSREEKDAIGLSDAKWHAEEMKRLRETCPEPMRSIFAKWNDTFERLA